MKVKELIAQMHRFEPEMEVFCYSEDEALLPQGHGFRLLDIVEISTLDGTRVRGSDGIPSMKIGNTPESSVCMVLEVTGDF